MKKILEWIAASAIVVVSVGGGLLVILLLIYGFRLFMNTTAPITVHEVEEGIHCAISSGGEAIDCWKV